MRGRTQRLAAMRCEQAGWCPQLLGCLLVSLVVVSAPVASVLVVVVVVFRRCVVVDCRLLLLWRCGWGVLRLLGGLLVRLSPGFLVALIRLNK